MQFPWAISSLVELHTPHLFLKSFPRLSQPNSEDVPLKEFRIPSKESCMQSETEALIEQDLDPPSPAAQSSKRRSLLTDLLDPGISFTRGTLSRSCSRDSVRSLRRASSLDDIDGMRAEWNSRPGCPQSNSSEWKRLHIKYAVVGRIVAESFTFVRHINTNRELRSLTFTSPKCLWEQK